MHFTGLALTVISSFSLFVAARPASGPVRDVLVQIQRYLPHPPQKTTSSLVTVSQLQDWLSTTDANITYIGQPIGNPSELSKRQLPNTMVVYCDTQSVNVCGGTCTVYNGGPTCLDAPNTACLMATSNVGFCDRGGCGGSCNQFSSCGSPIDNGFCSTPGTASITVGA
ncbi:hypothetical protein CVT26_010518 [Gymnopilus dilepis]|uniref:Uncharacterized protein n=1 Tax=Gymnopilus dilepis TaxID=231916 RepID=A0A409W511_9AGAR|nr:hypothetical protein CVT26_010518 [Gymnopilus dilepis]